VLAKDGYKNFYHYNVSPNLTKRSENSTYSHPLSRIAAPSFHKNALLHSYCKQSHSPLRLLNKAGGTSLVDETAQAATRDFIALVLISTGPEGTGAYHKHQSKARTLDEKENLNNDFIFVDRPYSKENFSHFVKWVNKNHLLLHYARLSPCEGETSERT